MLSELRSAIELVVTRLSWRSLGSHRLLASAFLIVLASFGALSALRPPSVPTARVLIAADDLSIGAELARADVKFIDIPVELVPPNALENYDQALGRVLSNTVPKGVFLTASAFNPADRFGTTPPGTVATPVRFPDPQLVDVLRPGDRINVLVARQSTGELLPAEIVARNALVLAIPQLDDESSGGLLSLSSSADTNIVILAVTESQSEKLAAASQLGALSVALVQ